MFTKISIRDLFRSLQVLNGILILKTRQNRINRKPKHNNVWRLSYIGSRNIFYLAGFCSVSIDSFVFFLHSRIQLYCYGTEIKQKYSLKITPLKNIVIENDESLGKQNAAGLICDYFSSFRSRSQLTTAANVNLSSLCGTEVQCSKKLAKTQSPNMFYLLDKIKHSSTVVLIGYLTIQILVPGHFSGAIWVSKQLFKFSTRLVNL